MKKLLLIMMVAMILPATINAKEKSGKKFGVKLGANFANTPGELYSNFKANSKAGFVGGIFFIIGNEYSIEPEILFSQQGATNISFQYENSLGNMVNYDKDITLNYVTIPIYLRARVLKFIHLKVGPQFGFLLDNKLKDIDNINEEYFKSMDFGMNFGLDVNLPFGLVASGTYNLGLGNVANQDNWKTLLNNTTQSYKLKNGVVQLMVGLRF